MEINITHYHYEIIFDKYFGLQIAKNIQICPGQTSVFSAYVAFRLVTHLL